MSEPTRYRNGDAACYAYTGTQQKFVNINGNRKYLPKLRRESDNKDRNCSCNK